MKRQPICPPGMYKDLGTQTEVADIDDDSCLICPETYYCRAGIKVDKCVAGYLCDEGYNTVPNPSIG